jgi:predicted exporter
MLAMLVVFGFWVYPNLKVETDILALLPTARSDVATNQAINQFSQALAGKILVLVGAPQLDQAKQSAKAFADSLRTSKSFSQVTLEQGALTQSMLALYWPHRDYLLSVHHRQLLSDNQATVLQQDALHAAFTPAGMMRPVSLSQDPLGLATDYLLQQVPGMGAAQLDSNVLVVADDSGDITDNCTAHPEPVEGFLHQEGGMLRPFDKLRTQHERKSEIAGCRVGNYVLITAELSGSPFASQLQDDALTAFEVARAAAANVIAPAKSEILMSGTLQHAAAARNRATTELTVFGNIEMILVMALLITVFSAIRPLVLGAITTALAMVGGLCATHFVFGTVHVLALVFGSSLIGGVIDYSIHFFADRFRGDPDWTPAIAVDHVGGTIVLGLATTLLSYVVLLLVPFPGLRQIALFCVAGLATGCLSVLCAYPVLYKSPRTSQAWGPRIGEWLTEYFYHWQWTRVRIIVACVLTGIALLGLGYAHIQDDVRALQSSPPELVAAEQRVAALLKSGIESRYFLVQGASEQAVLENEERLTRALDVLKSSGLINNYTAITRSLPSLKQQQHDQQLLQTLVTGRDGILSKVLQQLGFADAEIKSRVAAFTRDTSPLRVAEWIGSDAARPYHDLWLGNLNGKYATIVGLAGVKEVTALRQVAANTQGVQLVDRVNAVTDVLRSYRLAMSWLLGAVYVATWILLLFKYDKLEASIILVPSALASLVTLGLFGWLGVPVNLFTLLALWLVLGLGVDYGIFLRHGHTAMPTAVLSVTLSASTTLLAFGLLAFSATPFIRSIGLTLLYSITLSWLFAMLSCLTLPSTKFEGEHS